MKLVEFMAYWPGDYSKEQIEEYKAIHGDDRSEWPKSEVYSPITIDIELTARFNPGAEGKTTVDLRGANSITLNIDYEDYKEILLFNGLDVYNALPINNK